MKFIPIKTLRNIIPINQRLRTLYDAVNGLTARLNALEHLAAGSAQTVTADESAKVIDEPVAEAETVASDDAEESDDSIRQRAKDAGISSWHVKSIDNLKAELDAKQDD